MNEDFLFFFPPLFLQRSDGHLIKVALLSGVAALALTAAVVVVLRKWTLQTCFVLQT